MNNIKIIFFDIDGTLIDMQTKQITTKTIDALQRLKARNIKICIATGRSPLQIPRFAGIDFDAYLTYNGSYCYDHEKTLFSNPLSKEDVNQLIANAAKLQRPLVLATRNSLSANGNDDDLKTYFGFSKVYYQIVDDIDAINEQEAVYQIMIPARKEEYPTIIQDVKAAKIMAWWDRAVDIIPKDGGKGPAIKTMLAYYGFSKDEAMAFGDSNNDIAMLKTVGHGIAMKNASQELKDIAKHICDDVINDGIYHFLLDKNII